MSATNKLNNNPLNYLPDFSRIKHPTVYSMAVEYQTSDITGYVAEVLHPIPYNLQEPIQYTFANHVTKERPLSILHIAEELCVDPAKALGVVACVDILWNTGIVVDDIYDKDKTNAGQQQSAWARFGKVTALLASTAAVSTCVAYTARKYGLWDAYSLSQGLHDGIASLRESRALSLDAPLNDYYDNYDKRSSFYTTYPIATIGKFSDADPAKVVGAQSSLLRMNRAGQMINDLQDFDRSRSRSRTSVFSDIRNGVSSIPIRHMWKSIDATNQQRFLSIFGKSDLTDADSEFIDKLMTETGLATEMQGLITSEYATARDEYIDAVEPGETTLSWLDAWLAYKQEQVKNVIISLGSRAIS